MPSLRNGKIPGPAPVVSGTRSRSGARRAGDEYQDAVTLHHLVEWLEHRDRFAYVRLEAGEEGYLDDLVVQPERPPGDLVLIQVKYANRPTEDPLTWDYLIRSKKPNQPSLIKKWITSLMPGRRAILYTNRKPTEEMAKAIKLNGTVDIEKIPPHSLAALCAEAGSSEALNDFLTRFTIEADRPSLEDLLENSQDRLAKLGATPAQIGDLRDAIRTWILNRHSPGPEGRITYAHLQAAIGFHRKPRILQVPVPDDFVVPNAAAHDKFLDLLAGQDARCVVLQGGPGSGKTSYLSFVAQELTNSGAMVARHHFRDVSGDTMHRYHLERVASELIYQVEDELLRRVDAECFPRSQHANDLINWVRAGATLSAAGKKLIVIVDGLDNVMREAPGTGATELLRLLEQLSPIPDGVTVVLGMQPLALELPPAFSGTGSSAVEMPKMGFAAVREYILKKRVDLDDESEHSLTLATSHVLTATNGLPLLVKYLVDQLRDVPVHRWSFERRVQLSQHGGLQEYYQSLWASLSRGAKETTSIVATAGISWREDWLLSFLYAGGRDARPVLDEFRHLFTSDSGRLNAHGSLVDYIREVSSQDDVNRGRRLLREWLSNGTAPEALKWQHRWRVEAECGNNDSLINGVTRNWAIDSIMAGHSISATAEIVSAARGVALKIAAIDRFVALGVLEGAVLDANEKLRDESRALYYPLALLMRCQADLINNDILQAIRRCPLAELVALAEVFPEHRTVCLDEFRRRHDLESPNYAPDEPGDRDDLDRLRVKMMALCSGSPAKRVEHFKAVSGTRDTDTQSDPAYSLADAYGAALRASGKRALLEEAVELSDMASMWGSRLARHYALAAFEEGFQARQQLLSDRDPFCLLLRHLEGGSCQFSDIPMKQLLPLLGREEFITRGRAAEVAELFEWVFVWALITVRQQLTDDPLEPWLSALTCDPWIKSAACCLVPAAKEVAEALDGTRPARSLFSIPFESASQLEHPNFGQNRYLSGVAAGFAAALRSLSELCYWLPFRQTTPVRVEAAELQVVLDSPHIRSFDSFVGWYASLRCEMLSETAVHLLFEHSFTEMRSYRRTGVYCATRLAHLAAIASSHGDSAALENYTREAVNQLVSFGAHRDYSLHWASDMTQAIADVDTASCNGILAAVAPAVNCVMDITTGKDMSDVADDFVAGLTVVAPEKLPAYFVWNLERENFSECELALSAILKTAPVDSGYKALAAGVAEDELLGIVCDRRQKDDELTGVVTRLRARFRVRQAESGDPGEETSSTPSDPQDMASHPPERLEEYLKVFPERSKSDALGIWLDHWLKALPAVDLLKQLDAVDPEMRLVQPIERAGLARQAYGKSGCFDYLLKAHEKAGGWNHWSSRLEDVCPIWRQIHEACPQRWFDFFQGSVGVRGHLGNLALPYSPNPDRIVRYLRAVGQDDLAVRAAVAYVGALKELLEPLELEPVEWLKRENDLLDVLMARLTWPSVQVRERTMSALADVIRGETSREQHGHIRHRLLEWISTQPIELYAAFGVLTLVKAGDVQAEEIKRALRRPSLLATLLLREIDASVEDEVFEMHSGTTIGDAVRFAAAFDRHRARLDCSRGAAMIQERFGIDLLPQWRCEFEKLLGQLPAPPAWSLHGYFGRRDYEHVSIFDTRGEDVCQSAFLRALAWAVRVRSLPRAIADLHAAKTSPLDLGLWSVEPAPRPQWWPEPSPDPGLVSTAGAQIETALLNSLQASRSGSRTLLAVSGKIPCGGQQRFEVFVQGVFRECSSEPETYPDAFWVEPSDLGLHPRGESLLHLDGELPVGPIGERLYGTVRFWPATCSVQTFQLHHWQPSRFSRDLMLPSPGLGREVWSIRCDPSGILLYENGNVVGSWSDWLSDGTERVDANEPLAGGMYTSVSTDLVEAFERRTGSRLCWVAKITEYRRSYSGPFEELERFVLLGDSNIVLPTRP